MSSLRQKPIETIAAVVKPELRSERVARKGEWMLKPITKLGLVCDGDDAQDFGNRMAGYDEQKVKIAIVPAQMDFLFLEGQAIEAAIALPGEYQVEQEDGSNVTLICLGEPGGGHLYFSGNQAGLATLRCYPGRRVALFAVLQEEEEPEEEPQVIPTGEDDQPALGEGDGQDTQDAGAQEPPAE